jgi:hypothetical protein
VTQPGRTPRAADRVNGRRGWRRRRRPAAGRGPSLIAVIPLSSSLPVVGGDVGVGRPRGGHRTARARPPRWSVRVPASPSGLSLRGVGFRGFRCGLDRSHCLA